MLTVILTVNCFGNQEYLYSLIESGCKRISSGKDFQKFDSNFSVKMQYLEKHISENLGLSFSLKTHESLGESGMRMTYKVIPFARNYYHFFVNYIPTKEKNMSDFYLKFVEMIGENERNEVSGFELLMKMGYYPNGEYFRDKELIKIFQFDNFVQYILLKDKVAHVNGDIYQKEWKLHENIKANQFIGYIASKNFEKAYELINSTYLENEKRPLKSAVTVCKKILNK